MNYWLIKSEPETFSWDDLVAQGKATWDGVRNFAARNHLRSMKKGDKLFYYHSNTGKYIVGIAKVSKESFPDPTTDDPAWLAVEIIPDVPLRKPVTLEQIKADKKANTMFLVTHSRLSVQPVSEEHFKHVISLSEKN